MVDKEKFAKEDISYNVYTVAKNFQLTEPMRQHILEKLGKVERFHQHIMDVHVTMEIQKIEHHCVIVCHFNHITIKVEAASTDMYVSIDKAIQKLQHQFRKWKTHIQDYNKKSARVMNLKVSVYNRPPEDEVAEINEEIEAENFKDWTPGKVMATEVRILKILSTPDAIMKMELSKEPFLLFRDESDNKLKLIYRREDKHYGVIQAE